MREHKDLFRRMFGRAAVVAGAFALVAGTANAQNNFTDAGTNVENTFTLDYEVGTVAQPTITNDTNTAIPGAVVQGTETNFTVDRLIDLQVTQQNSPLSVAPGTTGASLDYLVSNDGNDNQSYSFSIADVAGDDFDGTYTVEYFIDVDLDGDPFNDPAIPITVTPTGTATTANITADIAPDQTIGVRVSSDIDATAVDTEFDDLILVAQTRDPVNWVTEGATGSEGDITAADAGGNTDTGDAENVLADGSGTAEEAANDGLHSDTGRYVVASPDMAATKVASVIDPALCGAATPAPAGYYVPGACVQYVITVENQGATATAENIDVVDNLPAGLIFFSASTTGWDGAPAAQPTETYPAAGANCDGPTEATGTNCEIAVEGGSLSAGEDASVTIIARVE